MKRRNFLKGLLLIPAMPLAKTELKPKTLRKGPFRVGDIVRYIFTAKSSWGYDEELLYKGDIERGKPYIGNLGVVKEVSGEDYALSPLDPLKPLLKTAWYTPEELELVSAVEDF